MTQLPENLVIIYFGSGKGKTTAAFGLAVRCIGQGGTVCICQFIKSDKDTGEFKFFDSYGEKVKIYVFGEGFVRDTADEKNLKKHCQAAQKGLQFLKEAVESRKYQLVIADELLDAYNLGFIELNSILKLLDTLPAGTHLVITGHSAPQQLIDRAHTVTEMNEIKHHYRMGIKAKKGIEF